jgi:outer membrane protein OmpA-like peptidoglycan-associated protein
MSDPVWVRGHFGEQYVLVDGHEILDLRTEAEARRFLEELGETALDSLDPHALPPGLRSDFESARGNREDQLAVLAQMLGSKQFTLVRLQRPFRRLDPIKSVPLSSLLPPKVDEPPAKEKETFAYEVRIVDELGEPVEGVPLSLSVSGSPRRLETDGDGRVKVDDATSGASVVQLPDLTALQDALRPRWEQPRDGDWLDEPDDHTYIDCAAPLPSVQIRSDRLHTIVVQPRVICARILELLFDTNKSFLLPSALEHIRKIRKLYDTRPRAKVLIVGHTDITGEPNVNDPLSLNRAKAVKAYLRDDVQTWLDFYGDHMHAKARWGPHEDLARGHSVDGGILASGEHTLRDSHSFLLARFLSTALLRHPVRALGAGRQPRHLSGRRHRTLGSRRLLPKGRTSGRGGSVRTARSGCLDTTSRTHVARPSSGGSLSWSRCSASMLRVVSTASATGWHCAPTCTACSTAGT